MKLCLILTALSLVVSPISRSDHSRNRINEEPLAPSPSPISFGAGIATPIGAVGAPADSVFAVRGGGTSEFWVYTISSNEWAVMPETPAPIGEGGGIVQIHSFDRCAPGRFLIATLRGGGTRDFWFFSTETKSWCEGPATPAPVGAGGAIAQLQAQGSIYVLRGAGTSDFWLFRDGRWQVLPNTPGPVGPGGGLAGINYGTARPDPTLYALQGGGSTAVWRYDVSSGFWSHVSDVPGPVGAGGAITSPNVGGAPFGTLDVLQGGESTAIWTLNVAQNLWSSLGAAPDAIGGGGVISSQVNGCDFAFVGRGSTQFFATGSRKCSIPAPQPDFSLALDNASISAERGAKLIATLTVTRVNGFDGAVTILAPETTPKGIKVPPDPLSSSPTGASFRIKVKAGAKTGTHTLTFTAIDANNRFRTATLALTVR